MRDLYFFLVNNFIVAFLLFYEYQADKSLIGNMYDAHGTCHDDTDTIFDWMSQWICLYCNPGPRYMIAVVAVGS